MRRIFFITTFFLTLITACTTSRYLPQGWKVPANEELKDAWRNESADKFAVVKGDFNGDGIDDEARLLMRKDDSAFGVFAFMVRKDQSFKAYRLDEIKDKRLIRAFGIKKVLPGTYVTACGKGYWNCQQDEAPQINIKNEAIEYFKNESASSFFYWNNSTNNFERIWISD